MNNVSNNNKNTLCSYIILTLPLNKKGILQQHHARERGLSHQQHQVGERTTSSISSWNTDWHIYKSSEVLFIGSIIILKGMQSSSTSICISVKLIHHHHHHHITRLAHHNNTRVTLHHNYPAGSIVLVSSHRLLYVTAVTIESICSSYFTSQPSGRKKDTRLALHHSYPAGSSVLVSSHHLCFTSQPSSRKQGTRPALRHNQQVESRILYWLYVTTIQPEEQY
jgi:hypothetical protein